MKEWNQKHYQSKTLPSYMQIPPEESGGIF